VRNIPFPLSVEESRALYQDDCSIINPFDKVITSGVKWVADGTQLERGSGLKEPYYDHPVWSGLSNFTRSDLNAIIADTLGSYHLIKHQRLVHATGDQTVSDLIASMNLAGSDFSWRFRRFRIEHGDMIQPEHMSELASKGVVVVQNPTHFGLPATMFSRVGPQRFATLQPMRSLIDAGIPVALGSDALGTPPNPYLDMLLAVMHPTNPAEAISLPEAVVAYTAGGAYAEFMGHLKGTLKKGQLADIAVLSLDIFNPENGALLPTTTSILTLVDGKIVWDAERLDIVE
jgi:predicted amidohydrolase YtcJ